jgi:hypothetical protein
MGGAICGGRNVIGRSQYGQFGGSRRLFQSCIDFASRQSTLQPKKIGEIGTMWVTMYFKLSEQNLRPAGKCAHVGAAALHSRFQTQYETSCR